ncbi:hypothetical protein KEM55_006410 [Ascosphaera atra]|nr:hypothetical protein KEM55_006410 [Ascosphaera atra]
MFNFNTEDCCGSLDTDLGELSFYLPLKEHFRLYHVAGRVIERLRKCLKTETEINDAGDDIQDAKHIPPTMLKPDATAEDDQPGPNRRTSEAIDPESSSTKRQEKIDNVENATEDAKDKPSAVQNPENSLSTDREERINNVGDATEVAKDKPPTVPNPDATADDGQPSSSRRVGKVNDPNPSSTDCQEGINNVGNSTEVAKDKPPTVPNPDATTEDGQPSSSRRVSKVNDPIPSSTDCREGINNVGNATEDAKDKPPTVPNPAATADDGQPSSSRRANKVNDPNSSSANCQGKHKNTTYSKISDYEAKLAILIDGTLELKDQLGDIAEGLPPESESSEPEFPRRSISFEDEALKEKKEKWPPSPDSSVDEFPGPSNIPSERELRKEKKKKKKRADASGLSPSPPCSENGFIGLMSSDNETPEEKKRKKKAKEKWLNSSGLSPSPPYSQDFENESNDAFDRPMSSESEAPKKKKKKRAGSSKDRWKPVYTINQTFGPQKTRYSFTVEREEPKKGKKRPGDWPGGYERKVRSKYLPFRGPNYSYCGTRPSIRATLKRLLRLLKSRIKETLSSFWARIKSWNWSFVALSLLSYGISSETVSLIFRALVVKQGLEIFTESEPRNMYSTLTGASRTSKGRLNSYRTSQMSALEDYPWPESAQADPDEFSSDRSW